MIESMINPKRLEKGPIKMLFIGMLYASLSLLLVQWFFSKDVVLYQYSGIMVVTFCVMFSLPFMYYLIKKEEEEDEEVAGFFSVWEIHKDAVYAFTWLFLGFIIAFSFWYIFLGDQTLFNAQIETYCMINSPENIDNCVGQYAPGNIHPTGAAAKETRFLSVVSNNIYVMIFTLIFSLIFGAGAIFVLAWNASVISTAVGVFTQYQINEIPIGIARYMIHGLPEITAYFITALAGGIFGAGIIRNGVMGIKFLRVLDNVIVLLFFSIVLIIFAGLVEVYLTPMLFS